MWKAYLNAATIEQALTVLADKKDQARIIAGGTDLVLEMREGNQQKIETVEVNI